LTIHGASGEKWTSRESLSSQECPRAIFTIGGAYPRAAERREQCISRVYNMRLVARDACGVILLACAPRKNHTCTARPMHNELHADTATTIDFCRNFDCTPETETTTRAYQLVWKYSCEKSLNLPSCPLSLSLSLSLWKNLSPVLLTCSCMALMTTAAYQ